MSDHLFGRNRRTSAAIIVLGAGVVLAGVGATAVASGANLGQRVGFGVPSGTLFLAVQVGLLGLVAAAAYANDGLAVCWALVLVASAYTSLQSESTFAGVAVPVVVATFVIGTVGYTIGRGAWLRRTGAPYPDDRVWTFVAGRDAAGVRRSLAGATLLGLAFFVAWIVTAVFRVPLQEFAYRTFGFLGAFVLMTAAATVVAYTNGGLVLSWAAAFAPAFGFALGVGVPRFNPVAVVLLALVYPSIAAVVFGTAGFVIGAVLWRVRGFVAGDGSSEERRGTAEDGSESTESRNGAETDSGDDDGAPTAAAEQTHE